MKSATFKVWRGDQEGGDFETYDVELEPGYVAVAVPIFDARGNPVAAMKVGGPLTRLTREQLESIAIDLGVAARAIRRELGG